MVERHDSDGPARLLLQPALALDECKALALRLNASPRHIAPVLHRWQQGTAPLTHDYADGVRSGPCGRSTCEIPEDP